MMEFVKVLRRWVLRAVAVVGLLLLSTDCLARENCCKSCDDQLTVRIAANHADINKTMPVYEFEDDAAGEFLTDFLTSITELPYKGSVILIKNTDDTDVVKFVDRIKYDVELYDMVLPENCVFLRQTGWTEDYVKQCEGIVILPNRYYGLIFSDSKEWLDKLHLKKADKTMTVYYGESNKKKGVEYLDDMLICYDIWAVLDILPNGKVDPLMIYNNTMSVQNDAKMSGRFDWIEDFYKRHNLPAGCGYYSQPVLDPGYRETPPTVTPPAEIKAVKL